MTNFPIATDNLKGSHMSKMRQALKYEHRLSENKVKAHTKLTDQALNFERQLADTAFKGQVALQDKAIEYERRITDSQFSALKALSDEHHVFHEREHILYDDAVEKASASLQNQLATLQVDLDRLTDLSHGLMTVVRFEREHEQLIERMNTQFKTYDEKISTEEKVTVRQDAAEEVLDKISVNNRWIIGLMITTGATLIGLALHVFRVY